MLKLALVLRTGEQVEIEVEQVEFVVKCPWCGLEFHTIDPDKRYCRKSHGVRASEERNLRLKTPL